jgi:L-asparaginase
MTAHPEMIAGEGRLDTALMTASSGRLIAKAGAEGYYGVGFQKGGHGYGVAFKVADGEGDRARTAMVLRALADLEIIEPARLEEIAATYLPPIENRRGIVVGRVEARFHLKPVFAPA